MTDTRAMQTGVAADAHAPRPTGLMATDCGGCDGGRRSDGVTSQDS